MAEPTHHRVQCRRLDVPRTVDEHLACPYCFGDRRSVATGEPGCFCDYQAGEDPIVFGFPPDGGRWLEG